MANEGGSSNQVMKRYQLFDVESYEEKAVKKEKGASIAVDTEANLGVRAKVTSILSSQGIAVINEYWYILGVIKSNDIPGPIPDLPLEEQSMLFVAVKGQTTIALQSHVKNFGIWYREAEKTKYIITIGEDYIEERFVNPQKADTTDKSLSVVIKIWDAEKLANDGYYSIEEDPKEESKNDMKSQPKIIYLNRTLPFQHLSSASVSNDLTHIALGLATGAVLVVAVPDNQPKSLCIIPSNTIQFINLTPDTDFATPVTNIYLTKYIDENMYQAWNIYCTCDKGFYLYTVVNKKSTLTLLFGSIVEKNAMDGYNDTIVLYDSQTNDLRKYEKNLLKDKYSMKDVDIVRIIGNQIMIIQASDKNKTTIRINDMKNGINSYQSVVTNVLGVSNTEDCVYLLLDGPNSKNCKIMQTLREKNSIDKLEAFIKKKHYDVALNFAENEKFAPEVLADISRYYGDFYLGKVNYESMNIGNV